MAKERAAGTLATESTRWEGGILLNSKGERFMHNYNPGKTELGRGQITWVNKNQVSPDICGLAHNNINGDNSNIHCHFYLFCSPLAGRLLLLPLLLPISFFGVGAIFLILIIFFLARAFFRSWRGGDGYYLYPQRQKVDESIQRERDAKREITNEQFEYILRDLRQQDY